MNAPRRNITKCYAINFAWGFILLSPIMVPFFLSKGISLDEVFIIQAAFGITLGLLDIPTGYFSDIFGRKITLVIASLLRGAGATLLVLGDGFAGLLVGYILIGAANSFLSGSNIALLFESHEAVQGEKPSVTKIQGHNYFLSYLSITIAALAGGLIAKNSIETAAIANCIMAWMVLPIALTLEEPSTKRLKARDHLANFKGVFVSLFSSDLTVRALVFIAISYMLAPTIAAWTLQVLWKELGFPIVSFGIIAASQNIISAFSGRYADRVVARIGWSITLALLGMLPIAAFFGTSVELVPVAIGSAFLFEVIRSLVQVVLISEINRRIPAQYRATSNSVLSFCNRVLYFGFGPIMGYLIVEYGAAWSLRLFSGVYVAIFLLVCLPLLRVKVRDVA